MPKNFRVLHDELAERVGEERLAEARLAAKNEVDRQPESRFTGGRTGHDKERGLYHKYDVVRADGRQHLHEGCDYFVLDLTHDPFAPPALRAYAEACREKFPALAADLDRKVEEVNVDGS